MLEVFIEEVPEVCFEHVDHISALLVSLLSYEANTRIRASSANSLPGLMRAAKVRQVTVAQLHAMAQNFNVSLYNAIEKEQDTDTMINQVQSFKEILDEAGPGLMNAEEVQHLADKAIDLVARSLDRIEKNNKLPGQEVEDEDDALDEDDIALIKGENSNEYDLQIAVAELIGILFKTHKESVANLVQRLRNEVIPSSFACNETKRQKFALFLIDDMIEHLGPAYFS